MRPSRQAPILAATDSVSSCNSKGVIGLQEITPTGIEKRFMIGAQQSQYCIDFAVTSFSNVTNEPGPFQKRQK